MPEAIYLADICEGDYERFRERDATLPATYREWLALQSERFNAMRRRGLNPVRYVIDFEDCAESLRILRAPHSQASRDDYAQTQGLIEEGERRRRLL